MSDSAAQNKATVRKFFNEVCNKGNREKISEIFAENVSFNGKPGSHRDIMEYLDKINNSFDNPYVVIEEQLTEKDLVTTRRVWTGTQKADYQQYPSSGKKMTWTEVSLVRLSNGRIVEDWMKQGPLFEVVVVENNRNHSFGRWLKKNKTLAFLVGLAIALIAASAIIHTESESRFWGQEVSKSMLGLGITVIFGSIIKLMVDEHEKDKQKRARIKEFQNELLNRLRKVFDDVEVSRILITSHKSAKTYGEAIRDNIIPASVTLYDIKRSLVAAPDDLIEKNKRNALRVNMHYMLAYLTVLIDVYKNKYLEISNQQYLHEEIKKEIKESTIKLFKAKNRRLFSSLETLQQLPDAFYNQVQVTEPLNQLSEDLWNTIEKLKNIGDFIKEGNDTDYYRIFTGHYENCKRILKGIEGKITNDPPYEFEKYNMQIEIIDELGKKGPVPESESLVKMIMAEKLKYPG